MKKTLLAIAITASTFSGITMAAPGDAVPNTFSNGTPADATLVNENFDALSTQIGDLAASGVAGPVGPQGPVGIQGPQGDQGIQGIQGPAGTSAPAPTVYNFRDFSQTFNTKTFTVADTNGGYDKEIRTFTRVPGVSVSFTRERTLYDDVNLIDVRQQYHTITFDVSGSEMLFTKFEGHNKSSLAVVETRTMTPGVTFRTETMELGKTFGSDSYLTWSRTDGTSGSSAVNQTVTLISANQTVTVNGKTYNGCIKIARHRNSTKVNTYDAINTHCPGVGMVRSVTTQLSFTAGDFVSVAPTLSTQSILLELSACNGDIANCVQP